jgi:HSP20 family protein
MKKRSIFERLSGSPSEDDYDSFEEDYAPQPAPRRAPVREQVAPARARQMAPVPEVHEEEHSMGGELPVDVYQTPNEIVIRTFVAGVRPEELNVTIRRDMVVIEGTRESSSATTDEDYFHQELFWGSFSRTVLLPEEIDVDSASAGAKDGLLTLVLPKLDKARQTRLKVKTG